MQLINVQSGDMQLTFLTKEEKEIASKIVAYINFSFFQCHSSSLFFSAIFLNFSGGFNDFLKINCQK
jgi:hypothetical protein